MGKASRILIVIIGIFICIDLLLGWRYFSLSKSQRLSNTEKFPDLVPSEKQRLTPFPCEEPQTTPVALIPPEGKLLNPLVVGIQSHKVENQDVYELVGWVTEADEQKREIVVGQPGVSLSHKVIVSPEAIIRLAVVDERGNLFHQPKTFADLIPGKVRVNILCKEAGCLQAEIVSIIEQTN